MDTTVKVRLILDVETNGNTSAEELGWLVEMLRFELNHWPRWKGRVRRIALLKQMPPEARRACRATRPRQGPRMNRA